MHYTKIGTYINKKLRIFEKNTVPCAILLTGRNKRKGEGRPIGRLFREKAEGQPLSFPLWL
jgi:hypothetical protein